MIRYFTLAALLLSILAGACSGRKSKAEHKDIIPERDLIMILAEVHLADGLLTIRDVRQKYSGSNNLTIYNDIFEKYGYNDEMMDKTIRFYFMRRPKKLIKIYDKVLSHLSEMETKVRLQVPAPVKADDLNLWNDEDLYMLPGKPESDSAWIEFPIELPGRYTLTFSLTLFPGDDTIDPRCGFFISPTDTAQTEKRDYFSTLPFIKDGYSHRYMIALQVSGQPPLILKGWFINYENQHPGLFRHLRVEKVSLTRQFLR